MTETPDLEIRGQVPSANIVMALDAIPDRRLGAPSLLAGEAYCTLGALARWMGVDVDDLEAEEGEGVDSREVGARLGMTAAMAEEIMSKNDDGWVIGETDRQRWARMRRWAIKNMGEEARASLGGSHPIAAKIPTWMSEDAVMEAMENGMEIQRT